MRRRRNSSRGWPRVLHWRAGQDMRVRQPPLAFDLLESARSGTFDRARLPRSCGNRLWEVVGRASNRKKARRAGNDTRQTRQSFQAEAPAQEDEHLKALYEAIERTSRSSRDRAQRQNELATMLLERFQRSGRPDDLDECIRVQREAAQGNLRHRTERADMLGSLRGSAERAAMLADLGQLFKIDPSAEERQLAPATLPPRRTSTRRSRRSVWLFSSHRFTFRRAPTSSAHSPQCSSTGSFRPTPPGTSMKRSPRSKKR